MMLIDISVNCGNFSGNKGDGNDSIGDRYLDDDDNCAFVDVSLIGRVWYGVMIVVDTSTPNQSSVVREASSCSEARIWQTTR